MYMFASLRVIRGSEESLQVTTRGLWDHPQPIKILIIMSDTF